MAGTKRKSSNARDNEGRRARRRRRRRSPTPTPMPQMTPVQASSVTLPIRSHRRGSDAGSEGTVRPAADAATEESERADEDESERESERGGDGESEEEDEDDDEDEDKDDEDEDDGSNPSDTEEREEMFSVDVSVRVEKDWKGDDIDELERARLKAIDRIRILTRKEPEEALSGYLQPEHLVVGSWTAKPPRLWGKVYLEKLAQIYAYAKPKELNKWMFKRIEKRTKGKKSSMTGIPREDLVATQDDLKKFLGKCKRGYREGKRGVTKIED